MIDWSATAAWVSLVVTLVISLLVPLATTYLNNKHQMEIKKLDLLQKSHDEYNLKMREVFENFILMTSKEMVGQGDAEQTALYLKSYHELLFYTPQLMWNDLEELDFAIHNNLDTTKQLFLGVVIRLVYILENQEQSSPR